MGDSGSSLVSDSDIRSSDVCSEDLELTLLLFPPNLLIFDIERIKH